MIGDDLLQIRIVFHFHLARAKFTIHACAPSCSAARLAPLHLCEEQTVRLGTRARHCC